MYIVAADMSNIDSREKKIPRIGSSSSATGQDKREKDPRDKGISSNDRKLSRDEKETNNNNNNNSSRHKEREHESRGSSSRIVEIERPSSRGAMEKKDKKDVKEEVCINRL